MNLFDKLKEKVGGHKQSWNSFLTDDDFIIDIVEMNDEFDGVHVGTLADADVGLQGFQLFYVNKNGVVDYLKDYKHFAEDEAVKDAMQETEDIIVDCMMENKDQIAASGLTGGLIGLATAAKQPILTVKIKDPKAKEAMDIASKANLDYTMSGGSMKFKSDGSKEQNDAMVKIMELTDYSLAKVSTVAALTKEGVKHEIYTQISGGTFEISGIVADVDGPWPLDCQIDVHDSRANVCLSGDVEKTKEGDIQRGNGTKLYGFKSYPSLDSAVNDIVSGRAAEGYAESIFANGTSWKISEDPNAETAESSINNKEYMSAEITKFGMETEVVDGREVDVYHIDCNCEVKDGTEAAKVILDDLSYDDHVGKMLLDMSNSDKIVLNGIDVDMEQLHNEIATAGSEIKEVCPGWLYYFDGSGGEFYANCSKEELEKALAEDEGEGNGMPFETAMNIDGQLHFYNAGNNSYPDESHDMDDIKQEMTENGYGSDDSEESEDEESEEESEDSDEKEISDEEAIKYVLEAR
jgi:hypothetical protein